MHTHNNNSVKQNESSQCVESAKIQIKNQMAKFLTRGLLR